MCLCLRAEEHTVSPPSRRRGHTVSPGRCLLEILWQSRGSGRRISVRGGGLGGVPRLRLSRPWWRLLSAAPEWARG
ncbi:hypothetical protein AMIS_4600 [Actinoplanes missouriensis 431]|uniref:Uncharacterized protein n=1 Tax=Actinoplanes missouriensis (strain ATCC 14538 / DSM 43046 / CBS 188.64 / JCM 3121 / NBRC 102363 / NCIMB 12654 / NRRL B-3342 / UNCC 431) TaxID=512565 RepID=I0GY43_ACTM4|nr:hypothetical protein AMIS_4600 [Actinoplanes missouriensis 431]